MKPPQTSIEVVNTQCVNALIGRIGLRESYHAGAGLAQREKSTRPKPPARAECALAGGKTITVDYSSPRVNGRRVFGGFVTLCEVWRAGGSDGDGRQF
jgi:hypothetical protein